MVDMCLAIISEGGGLSGGLEWSGLDEDEERSTQDGGPVAWLKIAASSVVVCRMVTMVGKVNAQAQPARHG